MTRWFLHPCNWAGSPLPRSHGDFEGTSHDKSSRHRVWAAAYLTTVGYTGTWVGSLWFGLWWMK